MSNINLIANITKHFALCQVKNFFYKKYTLVNKGQGVFEIKFTETLTINLLIAEQGADFKLLKYQLTIFENFIILTRNSKK